MPDFSVEIIPASNGPMFLVKRAANKQQSEPMSAFQAIGLIYRIADAMVNFDPALEARTSEFVSHRLSQCGWPEQMVECFLAAPDWPSRMLTAWCFVGENERVSASELDYGLYINYWPSQAFLET